MQPVTNPSVSSSANLFLKNSLVHYLIVWSVICHGYLGRKKVQSQLNGKSNKR